MSSSPFVFSRLRDADEFARIFAAHEPLASLLVGTALDHGLNKRTTKCMLVHSGAGELAGAVILHRWMIDRWVAFPFLIDLAAGEVIADFVDRGPAEGVHCSVSHAAAITPFLTRERRRIYEHVAYAPYPIEWGDPDPRARLATPADDKAIFDIYWPSQLNSVPSKFVLRRQLKRDRARNRIVVLDAGGDIGVVALAGYITQTPSWMVGGDMVVHPDHRGHGYSWAMVGFGAVLANEQHAGAMAFVRNTNPMSIPEDTMSDDDFVYIVMRSPRRFRGEPRVRGFVRRLLDNEPDREAWRVYDHDRIDRTRRTKAAWRAKRDE